MTKTPVVTREKAEEEINSWLDYKYIGESEREASKVYTEKLIEAIMDGCLVLEEDKTLVHKLRVPTDGEKPITELRYKPRVKISTIHSHMRGVKPGDQDGRVVGYLAAITSNNSGIISALDTVDYTIAQSIVNFFG